MNNRIRSEYTRKGIVGKLGKKKANSSTCWGEGEGTCINLLRDDYATINHESAGHLLLFSSHRPTT